MCTGYVFSFPFLRRGLRSPEPMFLEGFRTSQLYDHIFWTEDATLAFVGLPKMTALFRVAEAQCAVIARVYSGRLFLPCRTNMVFWEIGLSKEFEEDLAMNRVGPADFHSLANPEDRKYILRLRDWALEAFPPDRQGQAHPPTWSFEMGWMRYQRMNLLRRVRIAFMAKDEAERHTYNSAESLGFKPTFGLEGAENGELSAMDSSMDGGEMRLMDAGTMSLMDGRDVSMMDARPQKRKRVRED